MKLFCTVLVIQILSCFATKQNIEDSCSKNDLKCSDDSNVIKFSEDSNGVKRSDDSNVIKCSDESNVLIDETLNGLNQDDPRLVEAVFERLIQPPEKSTPYNFTDPDFVTMGGQFGEAEYLATEVFGNQRRGFFIEAGAFEGQTLSNSLYFEVTKGWTGLLVEANPDLFGEMKQKNRKANLLGHCLSTKSTAEVIEFDAAGVYGGIIKDGNKPGALGMPIPGTVYDYDRRTVRMQCFPLYSILLALGNPTVDLLSLDIEGAELQVLQSIPWDKVDIQVLIIEVAHVGRIFNPENETIEKFLSKQGYKLNASIHINQVFIRDDFVLQKLQKPFNPNFREVVKK